MAAITIRNLDDDAKERLRVRAATNGRSMEAEARALIEEAVSGPYSGMNIGQAFRAMAKSVGYLDDLQLPSRKEPYERPVVFSDEWEREREQHAREVSERRGRQQKGAA